MFLSTYYKGEGMYLGRGYYKPKRQRGVRHQFRGDGIIDTLMGIGSTILKHAPFTVRWVLSESQAGIMPDATLQKSQPAKRTHNPCTATYVQRFLGLILSSHPTALT